MWKTFCFSLFLMGFCAGRCAAQCSAAPAAFSATCAQLQGELDTFNATIDSRWNGVKSPVSFATDLTTANANRGLQVLLSSTTLDGVQNQLNGFALVGVNTVTLAVGFPILYQPFYQYNQDPQDYAKVLSFFQSVMAEVRKRGMKVVIETSVMFPDYATDLPLAAYYATLSAAQVTSGRAQVAQTIAQQLQPDWLNLGSEPDTQSALLGLKTEYTPQEYATEIATIVNQLRAAGIAGKPLIGAGIGTWQANGSAYIQALTATALDFIDLHIYSINLGYLAAVVPYLDMARAAGKGVALSEAWLKKLSDAQLQGKGPLAVVSVLSSNTTNANDTFSFWAPLDAQFIQELVKLAFWKNLYYISPFNSEYFFAYLDYNQVSGLAPDQVLARLTAAATAAMRNGTLTTTGQAYAAAIKAAAPPQAVTVSAASGQAPVAPGSVARITGNNLAAARMPAAGEPLSTILGGVTVTLTDSGGFQVALPLFYVGPQQIIAVIPDGVATGPATLSITTPSGNVTSSVVLAAVAPGLFSADGSGSGAALAGIVVTHADGSQGFGLAYQCTAGACLTAPIDLSSTTDSSTLVLYGTGIHNFNSISDVTVEIAGQALAAVNAGPAAAGIGLDEVTVSLPAGLAGSGDVTVQIAIAGAVSNAVTVTFK